MLLNEKNFNDFEVVIRNHELQIVFEGKVIYKLNLPPSWKAVAFGFRGNS